MAPVGITARVRRVCSEVEAIRRRLSNAVSNYREKKELREQLLEDGPIPGEKITKIKKSLLY